MRFFILLFALINISGCMSDNDSRLEINEKKQLVLIKGMEEDEVGKQLNDLGFYENRLFFCEIIGGSESKFIPANSNYEVGNSIESGGTKVTIPAPSKAKQESINQVKLNSKPFGKVRLFTLPNTDIDCGILVEYSHSSPNNILNRYSIIKLSELSSDKMKRIFQLGEMLDEAIHDFPNYIIECAIK